MKKSAHIILIPIYNDWKSLNRLISEIDKKISDLKSFRNEVLIINDRSTKKINIKNKQIKNIKRISLITLQENSGSQKAIAAGLAFIRKKRKNVFITVMDGDGEDQPKEIMGMLKASKKFKNFVITSNRKKRKETFVIRLLYNVHLILTFLFTFKWMSFGNFTTFHSKNLEKILKQNDSLLAHSSSIIKNCKIKRLFAKRGKRYFDKSKLSLVNLIEHSLRVNAVFLKRVSFSSFFYLLILHSLNLEIFIQTIFSILVIIFWALIIYIENKHSMSFLNIDNLVETVYFKNNK